MGYQRRRSTHYRQGRRRAIQPRRAWLLLGLWAVALALAASAASAADSGRYTLYLPSVVARKESLFGLDTTSLSPERGMDGLIASGASWVRASNLLWRDVEPVEGGGYHWDAPSV